MLTKEQEIILKYLLSLERNVDNKTNISRSTYTLTNVSETDFISTINYFEKLGLINKHWYDIHQRDFNRSIEIEFLPEAITYFKNKKVNKSNKRKEFVKWLLPLIISIMALLISLYDLIRTYHLEELIK